MVHEVPWFQKMFFSLEVILFGVFSGKFGEIWEKILRTPKNLPAPTPMLDVVLYQVLRISER